MVILNKIYTKTGDKGTTALGTGKRVPKFELRIDTYGTVDETNSCIGLARHFLQSYEDYKNVDDMLSRIQNDMFDLGADLCVPDTGEKLDYEPLRITSEQVTRLEGEIDELNNELSPLRSFVLPGGSGAASALHMARTICRRAERLMVELSEQDNETVSEPALQYINRLSDFLFVASRYVNNKGENDVLWKPGANR
ncbi:MAG: cob(I)yrinic acid a,c-diamide adenosyltransferase [Pseudomonadota bacterium]